MQPDGELPSIRNRDATFWEHDRLLFCLMFDNEEMFEKGLDLLAEKKPSELEKLNVDIDELSSESSESSENDDIETLETWRDMPLLKVAVLRGLSSATERLGSLNENINFAAIHFIYDLGRWACLQKLLKKREKMGWKRVKLADYITFLMRAQTFDKDFKEIEDNKVDFSKCVDLLFKYADYEVNEQNDDHYSALHLAVMYNKPKVIFNLLKDGAYIGMQDKMDRPSIWNINPKTLEKYFDNCINGDDLIIFNFENLISPSEDFANDMAAIEYISNSYDLWHLLKHPLISSFIFLKWTRLALLFYMDFLCYFLLSLATGWISMYYIADPARNILWMCIFTSIFIGYITLRRTLQLMFCARFKSWANLINSLLTICIVFFLIVFVIAVPLKFYSSTLAAICILLISYEFFTLAGTFWHFSIYSEMFIAVAMSSVKSLQLYAIFLPAFSLLFYILLCDPAKLGRDDVEADLNKFTTLGSSFVKTIVMSAGEFDAPNIDFYVNNVSVFVFVGFIFLISTVFMNLLNGLAVSDTQKIQAKAELTSYKRRCRVLARYEEVLSNKSHWFRYVWMPIHSKILIYFFLALEFHFDFY